MAWHHTYGLPVLLTNCSNNYGPRQFPEKLVPLTISKALAGELIPLYGDGTNIRDWLFVEDHVDALLLVSKLGRPGRCYCIGGNEEKTNLEIVQEICKILDILVPKNQLYSRLITFVKDRPGHDRRYSIDSTRIKNELGWTPTHDFDEGLKKTIIWYLENLEWSKNIRRTSKYIGERLGVN